MTSLYDSPKLNRSKTMTSTFRLAAIGLFMALVSACSNDPRPNVSLVSVQMQTPTQTIFSPGEPFRASFTINNEQLTGEHVGVEFFIIERSKAQQLIDNDEAEEFEVGIFYIENLVEGVNSYTADLFVPNDLEVAGEYMLIAVIDPAGNVEGDFVPEDNFSQNVLEADDSSWTTMEIDTEHHHDFILAKVEIGDGFLLLPAPEVHDETEAGIPATQTSDLIGFVDAIKHGSEIDTAIVTGVITVDGVEHVAHFWHEDDNTYSDSMDLDFPQFEEEHYFPFDIALNGTLVHELADAFDETADENTFQLTMTIVDTSPTEEDSSDNNTVTIDVPYFFFEEEEETTAPVGSERELRQITNAGGNFRLLDFFGHTYGDKSKVALNLGFRNQIDASSRNASASLSAVGGMSLSMFNNTASLFNASVDANVNASTLGGGYEVGVNFLGLPILEESDSIADRLSAELSQEWEEEVTIFEARFTIAIVPVKVEAGISRSVGIGASLGFDNLVIEATGTLLTASLDAFAEASIDLLVASGGVGASLLIIEDNFELVTELDLTEIISDSTLTFTMNLENQLRAIEGRFFLFVEYPGYKFCCKFPKKRTEKTIYNTGALFDKTWTLLSISQEINL